MQELVKIDILELLDAFELVHLKKAVPEAGKDTGILQDKDISSYLRREDKVLSIARQKMKKLESRPRMSCLEKEMCSITYDKHDGFKEILQKMSRTMRKYIRDVDFCPEKLEEIKHLIDVPIEIRIADPTDIEGGIYRKLTKERNQKLLQVTIREKGYPSMVIYGLKNHSHSTKYRNTLFYGTDYAIADMGSLLSYMMLLKKVNDTIYSQPELVRDICQDIINDNRRWHVFSLLMEKDSIEADAFKKHPVFEMEEENLFLEERLLQYFPNADFYYERKHRKNAIFLDRKWIRVLIWNCFPYEYGMKYPTGYHFLLEKGATGLYWPLPLKNDLGSYTRFLAGVWKKISEIQGGLERQMASYTENRTQYASSYQTKRNIPQKIVAAMERSVLNRYFGYVEYDELIDLSKVHEIEKEFVAFKETYFSSIDCMDNSIRFRRLGKHRAAGLYYPTLQCLCVDINNPSSLIHEFGHLIDHTHDNLSVQKEFMPIMSLYSDEIRLAMDTDEGLKEKMNGNTKYNFRYYTMPTEIFARCYEIYCRNELGISNSLINASGSIYPDSAELKTKISEYFGSLFKREERVT